MSELNNENRSLAAASRCADLANAGEGEGWLPRYFSGTDHLPVTFRRYVETIDARDREVLALLEQVVGDTPKGRHLLKEGKDKLRADLLPKPAPTLLEEFKAERPYTKNWSQASHDAVEAFANWIAKRGENSNVGE